MSNNGNVTSHAQSLGKSKEWTVDKVSLQASTENKQRSRVWRGRALPLADESSGKAVMTSTLIVGGIESWGPQAGRVHQQVRRCRSIAAVENRTASWYWIRSGAFSQCSWWSSGDVVELEQWKHQPDSRLHHWLEPLVLVRQDAD